LHKIKYPRLKVVKNWSREILSGLKYMHEFEPPIIHRDIKCENIFVNCNDGMIKIGDMGLSCLLNTEFAHSFSGTPEFMAPEIFKGQYGVKADIYSFGLCLLEMITIEKPYKECNSLIEVFEKVNKLINNYLGSKKYISEISRFCIKSKHAKFHSLVPY
jgi:WNK lysine deficient protein kinase